nr:hypothetical protein [Tanacetum cinerariifolium]
WPQAARPRSASGRYTPVRDRWGAEKAVLRAALSGQTTGSR